MPLKNNLSQKIRAPKGYDTEILITKSKEDKKYFNYLNKRLLHYQTQAAIYALALHRWLEQRLIGYDPASHLGEVVYLFARGIDGPMQGIWRQPIEAEAIVEIASRCLRA